MFVHAASSGGLDHSPTTAEIAEWEAIDGFGLKNGTVFDALQEKGIPRKLYGGDDFPMVAALKGIHLDDVRHYSLFAGDVAQPNYPDRYIFIEPSYDTGHDYVNGNSMHPLNDARKAEQLVKRVYEAIRASPLWPDTLLVITCDEHGGFHDHVPPPPAVAPGGDQRYSNPVNNFAFDLLGVRVPAIAVSAWTAKNTVIGRSPQDCYDHTAILATLEKRFGLPALTKRDAAAPTLALALNSDLPRLSAADAPMTLATSPTDSILTRVANLFRAAAVDAEGPLTTGQRVQLTLAHACDLQILDSGSKVAARQRYLSIRRKQDAADYIQDVEQRIRGRRKSPPSENL